MFGKAFCWTWVGFAFGILEGKKKDGMKAFALRVLFWRYHGIE